MSNHARFQLDEAHEQMRLRHLELAFIALLERVMSLEAALCEVQRRLEDQAPTVEQSRGLMERLEKLERMLRYQDRGRLRRPEDVE